MRPPVTRRRRSSRGYIMIAVLWLGIALLTALAAFLSTARHDALEARAEIAALRADLLARSGVNLALARLSAHIGAVPGAPVLALDGAPLRIDMAEGSVEIRVEDEAGKADLRHAPSQILGPLLTGLADGSGLDAFAAVNLAQGFADLNPMEGGVALDLRALLAREGLSPAAVRAASRHLTLLNGTAQMNPRTASRLVLASVPGMGPSDVEAVLARRATDGSLPQLGSASAFLRGTDGPIYTIRVRAELATGGTARVEAVVASRGLAFQGGRVRFDTLSFERLAEDGT